ncbi:hypothetical protein RJ639_002970 [Escallonia herrerae]|uniref:Chromosome transmission fidelity protein 18 homolog n=1 Tax=Escallonia herrerae TaxID=1293975 RepID=A0AA89AYB7_9ASTE|nr:hypothetical protein RJ639_002970 [Escallonia herrerae]
MDIPMADELEWLEANSNFPDDDVVDDRYNAESPPQPPPEEEEEEEEPQHHQPPPKPTLSLPPKPPQITQLPLPPIPPNPFTSKKRFLFETLDSPNPNAAAGSPIDKRSKIDGLTVPDLEIAGSSSLNNRSRTDTDFDEDLLRYSPARNEALNADDVALEEKEDKVKIVSRYASEIDGDCIPVTGPDGERVYVKISRVVEREERVKKLDVKGYSSGLIPEPISVLIHRVEEDAFAKVLQASAECHSDMALPKAAAAANEQLWVDKYAPSSFMELLSDEQTNREVLLWLKQWDSCVFGSEIKSTTDDILSSLRIHSSVAQHKKFSSRSYFGRNREPSLSKANFKVYNNVNQQNSHLKRMQDLLNKKHKVSGPPEQKILLLCGPPGLGKTTLAHVAARHCGYRVVEINASDDRSSSTIETKILDVVQMNSVIADSKPKCLVIDEIDGALGDGKGAVEVILKMVAAEKKLDTGKENVAQGEQFGRTSTKKKRKDATLLRPVICICNDLYAPALRPLRQVAKVHVFVQPTVSRIVSRLKYICNKEGMKTSSIAITALAEYTECDIRSCLNTLQFLNKKKESLNVLAISSQVVGRKDTAKSVFDVWKEVFQKKRVNRERKSGNESRSKLSEFEFLQSLISNRGDYDLIFDGIYENMLQLHYHDPVMQKTVKCLASIGVSDIVHQYIMRTQKMSLQVYQPAFAIAIHGLIAQVEKPNIEWPKSFQRYRTVMMEKMDTLHSWHNKISPYISRHLSPKSFVEDSISLLLHILSPPTLRPVAFHLLSDKEKNDLAQLVNTMVSYSVTYKNMKSDPLPGNQRHEVALDVSVLSFDPPIGDFINFKGYKSTHNVLALAVKQVLLHEVEKQKILQGGINRSMLYANSCNKEKTPLEMHENGQAQSVLSDYATTIVDVNSLSTSRQCEVTAPSEQSISLSCKSATPDLTLRSSKTTKKPSSGSNFFDRFRKVSGKDSQNTENTKKVVATMERDSRPLLFKFNETCRCSVHKV